MYAESTPKPPTSGDGPPTASGTTAGIIRGQNIQVVDANTTTALAMTEKFKGTSVASEGSSELVKGSHERISNDKGK